MEELISDIELLPRPGAIRNQVSILYKGFHIANARDCRNGFYEVRPKSLYFAKSDISCQMMDEKEIEEFARKSFVDKYYLKVR